MIQLRAERAAYPVVEAAISQFASALEPPVARAHQAHARLRERIRTDRQFEKHHIETFLGGSYRRRTAIRPLKDVDIFVILAGDERNLPPRLALKRLKSVLDRHYAAKTFPQRRSIRVDYDRFSLDVVPVLAPAGAERPLLVPDRELERWLPTHPKGHIRWVESLNASDRWRPAGSFVPLVKLIKAWRRCQLPDLRHPKGFALECWIGDIDPAGDSWGERIVSTLSGLSRRPLASLLLGSGPLIRDPGVPHNRISTIGDRAEFMEFRRVARDSLQIARSAVRAKSPQRSAELWRRLFGPTFPA